MLALEQWVAKIIEGSNMKKKRWRLHGEIAFIHLLQKQTYNGVIGSGHQNQNSYLSSML